MGCDIHLVLEKRDTDFGWVGIDAFSTHQTGDEKRPYAFPIAGKRNYRLFAALAGVRGEGPEPRGIPGNASALTRLQIRDWGSDGHSHSWLPLADAAREFNERRWTGETPADPESYRDKYPASYWFGINDEKIDDYRLIFWFDN